MWITTPSWTPEDLPRLEQQYLRPILQVNILFIWSNHIQFLSFQAKPFHTFVLEDTIFSAQDANVQGFKLLLYLPSPIQRLLPLWNIFLHPHFLLHFSYLYHHLIILHCAYPFTHRCMLPLHLPPVPKNHELFCIINCGPQRKVLLENL